MEDMRAAFDVVDHQLLLETLKLYGFDRNSTQWTWSYLTYRSQLVYIDGSQSSPLPLEAGVSQGSILGPLLFTIFTNELPEVVHGPSCPIREGEALFNIKCEECGSICCYADDSTYSAQGSCAEDLSEKLSEKYKAIADFLTANRLKVNDDKTHLLVMTTRQKRKHRDTNNITISTPTAIIQPSKVERLLGAQVHQDMHWKEHLLTNEDSLLKSLAKREGALKKICRTASFKTRKMIANGIFVSKLIYLMPVWMGCEDYLLNALQVSMNRVARIVTKLDIFTPTSLLMQQCGWLTVRQLISYHSLMLLDRTIKFQTPAFLFQKITFNEQQGYQTRQVADYKAALIAAGVLEQAGTANCELDITRRSWCWATVKMYNKLPPNLRAEKVNFKSGLKDWVSKNIDSKTI